MANFTIRSEGAAEALQKLSAFNLAAKNEVVKAVNMSMVALDREAKQPDSHPQKPHEWTGGVPKDIGRLQNSQRPLWRAHDGMAVEYGTDVEYALAVHEGMTKVPPRPWLQDSFDKIAPGYIDRIKKAIGDIKP
jgi:hypothetical protein